MADATTDSLPTDVASLQAMVVAMQEQLNKERAASLAKEQALTVERANVKALNQRIEVLKQQLAVLRRARYGRKSEKLDANIKQLELMIEDLESSAAELPDVSPDDAAGNEKPARRARRKPLPEHLPRDTVTHGQRDSCESCGGELVHIGDDVSEMLDYKPASFRVTRHVRPKYRCNCCNCIVQADAPGRPIARSIAGSGLLAHVAVSKFADHQPLYRQSQIYARSGVSLERSTLADWIGKTCQLLKPLDAALNRYVMTAKKLHADDTPVPVLQPGRKTTKQGRLWGYVRDDRPAGSEDAAAVWFAYSPDRKGKWPQAHLSTFSGTLQADGYAGFNALYTTDKIQEAACWAHVRRKFYEIDQTQPDGFASEVLKQIQMLYAIEADVRGKLAEQRRDTRQARAGPILDALKIRLRDVLGTQSRKSPLAKAISYALTRWDALIRYIDDGSIEIDNNAVEREIRPVALGRKNYLFSGSDPGGERAAMMYGLLNTAKLNGLDPEAYLSYVIEHIADHPVNRVDELLPWRLSDDARSSISQ